MVAGCSDATLTTPSGLSVATSAVNAQGAYLWWSIAAGGEQNFTTSPSVSDTVSLVVLEYTGMQASPLDVTSSATGTVFGTGPASPGTTAVTAQSIELAVAAVGIHSFSGPPSSPTWSDGFAQRAAGPATTLTATQDVIVFVADLTTSASGAQTTSVSWTGNANHWGAMLATFKAEP